MYCYFLLESFSTWWHTHARASPSSLRSTPEGVQCSHLFLTRWVSQLSGLALVSWAFARIGVNRPCLCLPDLLFPIRSFCHWISIMFLLYGRRIATHSVNPALTHFLGEFPGLGLDLIPNFVVPEADQRYTWSRKLDPNFCPGRGIPQTFASNARACKC